MRHAQAGGTRAAAVLEYLKSIEGADDKLATQPLSEAETAKLAGVYLFGAAAADKLEVKVWNNRGLQIARPPSSPRGLMHLGSLTFCPVGAENVRIVFAETPGAMTVTVHDPDVVVSARKAL